MKTLKRSNRSVIRLAAVLLGIGLLQQQSFSRADYAIQVGAFKERENATYLAERMQEQGFPVIVEPPRGNTSSLTRVLVGPCPDRTVAAGLRSRLLARGQDGYITGIATSPVESTTADDTSAANSTIVAEGTPRNNGESPAPASMDELFFDNPDEQSGSAAAQGDEDELPFADDELFGIAETHKKPAVRGFIQSEYAYTYRSPTHSSKFRNIIELGTSGRLDGNTSWVASVRGAYDAVFDLNNHYPSRVKDNRRFDGDIYETYMDISSGDFDFRLGRQNIIWGEMVGLFFADVVSAKDLRQFVAQDFDLIRIPQWAIRAEHFKGDFHTEAIWIPFMTYDQIGKPGDDFYPIQDFSAPPGFTMKVRANDQPTRDPSNSAYGLRFSFLKGGWDISTFYYRSVDAAPAFFRTIEMGPAPQIVITPKNKKIHQAAATLAKDFGPVVVKSEVIFTKDRRVNVDDLNDADGVVKQDILDYVIGLEHTTPNNTLLNFQVFQRWYTNHDSDIAFDEFETGVSFYSEIEVASKVEAEVLLISQLNRTDWMARPRINWTLAGHWLLQAGADIFGGDSVGLFGRFDSSDRVYTNVRYTF